MNHFLKLVVALCLLTATAYGAPKEFTGFELGTTDDIQSKSGSNKVVCSLGGVDNPENVSPHTGRCAGRIAAVGTGGGSFRVGAVGISGNVTATLAVNTAYYKFDFLVSTMPSAERTMVTFLDNADTPQVKARLKLAPDGYINVYDSTNTLVGTILGIPFTGEWQRIQFKLCTGSSCVSEIKRGAVTVSTSAGNFGTGQNGSAQYGTYDDTTNASLVYWFDNIVHDDAAYPNTTAVKMMLPYADGDADQWNNGTGASDWTQVSKQSNGSDAAIATTTYIRNPGNVTNEVSLFKYPSRASLDIYGSIKGLKVVALVQKDTASSAHSMALRLYISGTYSESGSADVGTNSIARRAYLTTISPFTAGEIAPEEIDVLQAGIREATSTKMRAFTLPVMVAYDPNGVYNTPAPTPTYIPPTPPIPPYVKVHPGSTGYGDAQVAGSGRHLGIPSTTLYRVTNLNNSGAGSLRACMEASGPRTCVFEVAGYIDLARPSVGVKADIKVTSPYLTVAGQTAPNPGIHIRNGRINITTHDVLLQHFSVRPGDAEPGTLYTERDGVSISPDGASVYNIVLDHMSLTYAMDENFSTSEGSGHVIDNISVTNSLIGQGLSNGVRYRFKWGCNSSVCSNTTGGQANCIGVRPSVEENCTDYKANHAMGAIIYPTNRINFHNNLIAFNYERNLRQYGNSNIEFINNVVHGWGPGPAAQWLCYDTTPGRPCKVYLHGNFYFGGTYSNYGPILASSGALPAGSQAFLLNNHCATRPADVGSEWLCGAGWSPEVTYRVYAPPLEVSGLFTPKTALSAFNDIFYNSSGMLDGGVGARPWNRFVGDTTIINKAKLGTGTLVDCISDCQGSEVPVFGTVGASTGWPTIGTASRTLTQLDVGGWNKDTIEFNGRTALENYIFSFNADGDPHYPLQTPTPTAIPSNTPTTAPTATSTPTAVPTITPGGPTVTPTVTASVTPTRTPTNTPTAVATNTPRPTLPAGYTPGAMKRFTPNFPFEPCNPVCCYRNTCPPECGDNYCKSLGISNVR